MTVDAARFERLVGSLEGLTERLHEVAVELRLLAERQTFTSREVATLRTDLDAEVRARLELRDDLNRWVNRGWGVWGALAAIFAVVTALGWHRPPEQPAPPVIPREEETSRSTRP